MMETAGITISLIGVYLTSQRILTAWIWNFIGSAIYLYIFFQKGLYSDMELQAIVMVLYIYGYLQWQKVQKEWQPTYLTWDNRLLGVLFATTYGIIIGYFHENYANGVKSPYYDATLTGFSLLALYWTAIRKTDNWLIWIVVNIAYVWLYIMNNLNGTATMYSIFILMAIRGWILWHKELKIN